jgi:hypothetical protein
MIERMGHEAIGPYAQVDAAIEALEQSRVDLAVLDFLLRKEESYPIAEILRARKIPFVLVTGWPISKIPRHWDGSPILSKPVSFESFRAVIANLINAREIMQSESG